MDKKTKRQSLEELIDKIERILDAEIDSLSETLCSVSPEKRLEFVNKTLPLVIKYREDNPAIGEGWI